MTATARLLWLTAGIALGLVLGVQVLLVAPYRSEARGCRAAGGRWSLVAASCDFGGSR